MSVGFYNLDFLKTRFSFALMTTCFFPSHSDCPYNPQHLVNLRHQCLLIIIYNLQTVYRYNTQTAHAAFSTDLEIARDMYSIAINRA